MSNTIPGPIAAYFDGKNARDFARALSGFSPEAIVHDEAHTHRGHDAIRTWMAETSGKYNDKSVITSSETDGDVVVSAEVSGTFPGSPIILRYRFALEGGEIASLEIGL